MPRRSLPRGGPLARAAPLSDELSAPPTPPGGGPDSECEGVTALRLAAAVAGQVGCELRAVRQPGSKASDDEARAAAEIGTPAASQNEGAGGNASSARRTRAARSASLLQVY